MSKTIGIFLAGSLLGLACHAIAAPPVQSMKVNEFGIPLKDCADPNNSTIPKVGRDSYLCIDTNVMSRDSYCLRQWSNGADHNNSQHVRGMRTSDVLVVTDANNNGYARVDFNEVNLKGPCAKDLVQFMDSSKNEKITIKRLSPTSLELKVLDSSGNVKPYFPVTLGPGPNDGFFYWTGTSPNNDIDFFVMLADDKRGAMGQNDVDGITSIEQYFRIEAFKVETRDNTSACGMQRPDYPYPSGTANFFTWEQGKSSCNAGVAATENGAGGGGHPYP